MISSPASVAASSVDSSAISEGADAGVLNSIAAIGVSSVECVSGGASPASISVRVVCACSAACNRYSVAPRLRACSESAACVPPPPSLPSSEAPCPPMSASGAGSYVYVCMRTQMHRQKWIHQQRRYTQTSFRTKIKTHLPRLAD